MEQLLRSAFLSLAKSRSANALAQKYGRRLGAQRFVAGETIADAIAVVRRLNTGGMSATLDHLGEFVSDEREAVKSADDCIVALRAIDNAGAHSSLSLKLTQVGLDIDHGLCLDNMQRVLGVARDAGVRVNIDMEDFSHCQQTLDVFDDLRKTYDNVDAVIQAYLYRSLADVERLARDGARLRIVKGAYKEPPTVAYPDKADVDRNYLRLVELQLAHGGFTAIATHDEQVIVQAKTFVEQQQIQRERFEFQMLYGIKSNLQAQLVAAGWPLRVYVPYGTDWYGYFMRRLAERPANVGFVLRGMLR